ncbi:MAG: hypothetical protein HQRvContig05_23 [Haloquadratum phage sp.]|nr:MAG: hypothetical protein HQRvContig05_23 [Haloquadratum phage sp.]
MSATHENSDETKNVSAQVDKTFANEFDRALKRSQLDGHAPMDMNRSDAIRHLMRMAIEDPSLFAEADQE